eukprot:2603615-Rhodomonas_salina.1
MQNLRDRFGRGSRNRFGAMKYLGGAPGPGSRFGGGQRLFEGEAELGEVDFDHSDAPLLEQHSLARTSQSSVSI